jgi:CBFA2/RNUX1 translocation partner 1
VSSAEEPAKNLFFCYDAFLHENFSSINQQHNSREERELRSINSESSSRGNRVSAGTGSQVNGSGSGTTSGDEEWRNIHTMLSCISGMVEKTKRAISILQHRGSDGGPVTHQDATLMSDIKRQTEEKIAEFRRNAEDAVNQVSALTCWSN